MAHEEVGGYENLLDKYSKAVPDPEFAAFEMVDGKNQVIYFYFRHRPETYYMQMINFKILRPEFFSIFLVLQ